MAAKKFYEGVGRRKTSSARVRIVEEAKGAFVINGKTLEEVFPTELARQQILRPFVVTNTSGRFGVTVKAEGGGTTGWEGAITLGLARALVNFDAKMKSALRTEGLMTRDPRAVERKKAGLKKARKAPRFSKR